MSEVAHLIVRIYADARSHLIHFWVRLPFILKFMHMVKASSKFRKRLGDMRLPYLSNRMHV
jgi:hypothetical protein